MKPSFIDMHSDTLTRSYFCGDGSFYDGPFMQTITHMRAAGQMAQFFAVFFPPVNELCGMSDEQFFEKILENFEKDLEAHSDIVMKARSASDILRNFASGQTSAVLTIEDGRMVNYSFDRLIALKARGVSAMALTWNYPNCFGWPQSEDAEIMRKGLTDFGKEAIGLMNEIGMLIDVSHLSDGGFFDVAEISEKPFIASHSNSRALCPHKRNLTDEMIRTLSMHGGAAGINFYSGFLGPDMKTGTSLVADLAKHVLHMLDVGGEDVVALGTDFDGIDGDSEISHPEEMYLLIDELSRCGMNSRQIDKFSSGNVLRVMKETLG